MIASLDVGLCEHISPSYTCRAPCNATAWEVRVSPHRECHRSVRQCRSQVRGRVDKLVRKTCEAMITLDVHSRDTTLELFEKKVSQENDFNWLAQLRWVGVLACLQVGLGVGQDTLGQPFGKVGIDPLTSVRQ